MAITIKDIAKRAGVSPSTVSRVCNNNPSISKETKDRVQKIMDELGYEPPSQEELPIPVIRNVGIVLPPSDRETYENSFYLKAIRGISQVCNQRHVATSIITGQDFEEILCSVKDLHQSDSIDGCILLYSLPNDTVVNYLCEQGLLYVVIGKAGDLAYQTVCIDNDNLQAS